MKLWITITLISLMTVSAYPREAKAAISGNALHALCGTYELACFSYILGAADGMTAFGQTSYCLPENVTDGQMQRVVQKYLEAHPEEWHFIATFLVLGAFNEAFPCD